MNRGKLAGRLYLSTIGKDSQEMAEKLGLGLEIAEFCTAVNLERDTALYRDAVLKKQARLDRFWFHAPFAELSSAAVDPRVREVTALRYRQAIQMATGLGIHRLVIHSGFIPQVYFPEWFVPQSVLFWQTFLAKAPENITIALENVMDPGPEMLVEIVRQVNDPRLGLCLDVGHANCRISKTPPLHWIEPMLPFYTTSIFTTTPGIWIYMPSWAAAPYPWRRFWILCWRAARRRPLQSKTKFAARRWYGCGNEAICPIRSAGRQLHK